MTATGVPEFGLTPDQTELLAKATQKVSRHFPSVLTEKQQDIAALIAAFGAVGYTQFRTYRARVEQAAMARAANDAHPVAQHMGGGIQ